MVKNKILEATNGIVAILEPLGSEDRRRALNAALTVLDDGTQSLPLRSMLSGDVDSGSRSPSTPDRPAVASAKAYFDLKKPMGKSEEFAVAARYREEHHSATETSKEEMEKAIREARRDFHSGNYSRDLDNARRAGYFNKGTGSAVLSHYGQSYVDALPDRDAAKAGRASTRKTKKKKSGRKKKGA